MTDPLSAQPPPPPPASPPPAPQGVIVRPKIFFLAFLFLLFKVHLSVDDGPPVVIPWAETFIPLAPGQHSLRCWVPYLFFPRVGDSAVVVDVLAGGSARAQWRSPWLVFLPGKWTVTSA
jgi:hypothetical protein